MYMHHVHAWYLWKSEEVGESLVSHHVGAGK